MSDIVVKMTKKVVMETVNGEMRIERKGDSYILEYSNPLYFGSPFKVPVSFSTEFTIEEIIKSSELEKFMHRFE